MTGAQFQVSGQQSLDLMTHCPEQPAVITAAFTISGNYTQETLVAAIAAVVDRHDILRTCFEYRAGVQIPLQTVYPPQGRENRCFSAGIPDLTAPWSIKVHPQATGDWQVIIQASPLILDTCSIGMFYREVHAVLTDQPWEVSTEELLQFGDYTNWEAELIAEGHPEATEFWRRITPVGDRVNSLLQPPRASAGRMVSQVTLPHLPLETQAAACDVPVKALLVAIFARSLARYTAGETLQVSYLENGRHYEELQYTMGPLSRLYPVYFPGDETNDMAAWAADAAAQLTQATGWNDYYYTSVNPLLAHPPLQFIVEYADISDDPGNLEVSMTDAFKGTFLCRVFKRKNTWELTLVHPAGMPLAAWLFDDLQNRLQYPALPGRQAGTKDLEAIAAYNDTTVSYSGPDTVPGLLLQSFRDYAGHIAVKGRQSLTYAALEEKVQRMAASLSATYGVGRGTVVGVLLQDDEQVAATLLGILFTGAAYVPLDSSNPAERLAHIIHESGCRTIITDEETAAAWKDTAIAPLLVTTSALEAAAAAFPSLPPLSAPAPEDTAYLIFTSGTTGKPKGCQVSHANLYNYISWANSYYFQDCAGHFPLLTSLTFDLTVTAIFTPLTKGATLHCLDKKRDITEQLLWCFDPSNEITCIKLTPTHISLLAAVTLTDSNIRCAIVGGEALHLSQVALLRSIAPGIRIYNEYGPTEATVGCIVKEITAADEQVTIGRPIANMRAAVLDADGNVLPVGVYGELYLAGNSVAIGYWQQPDLTAQKFVMLTTPTAERYYRTGDIVRLLPEGDMEFAGRIDDQVKIRGIRIELGEIRAHLLQFPGVEEVVVVVKKDVQEEQYITAYYIAGSPIPVQDWKVFLQSRVPDYMLPAFFVAIPQIPVTANGKLDVALLPDPFTVVSAIRQPYVAPDSPTAITIARIWEEILKQENIGLDDNFYEMGGHSLLAMRAVSAIRRELKADIVIKDLLVGPTIRALAALTDRLGSSAVLPEVVAVTPRPAQIPLSYAQERLWFIDQLRGSTHYHMPSVFRLKGRLQVSLLEQAFRVVVDRHESLRTVFKTIAGVPYQEVLPAGGWQLHFTADLPADLSAAIATEIDLPFDLSADHMLRARLFRLSEVEHVLVLVRHHIASDGWSASLMLQEFCEVYEAATQGREAALPALSLQYADYAIWQRSHLIGDFLEQQLGYWERQLKGLTPLQLPTDLPRPAVQSIRGDRLNFKVGKELSSQLQLLAQQENVTPFMLLLAVFKVLLYRYSGQTDICVGTTVAHRPQQELEPLIGFFVNTLVLRTDFSDNPSFQSLLAQVSETTLAAYAHIAVSFEKVVDRVEKERDKSRSSLFQVLFVMNNNEAAVVHELEDITIAPVSAEHEVAKFDLTFFVEETEEGFVISANYCTDLFLEETIERMKNHYLQLLTAIVEDHTIPVGHLPLLLPEETAALLSEAGHPAFESTGATTVTALFAEQVELRPDNIVLCAGNVQLSYRELDEKATRLAHYLQQTYAIKANDLVGILMENSTWSVIAILGILKAGGAYVPIDPSLPGDRQGYIISDT
ncbi:non-ribosomal peptide synthetase, partial [Chitinophaga flava]